MNKYLLFIWAWINIYTIVYEINQLELIGIKFTIDEKKSIILGELYKRGVGLKIDKD